MSQIQIKELGHAVLYITNLETMVDFYERILGFKLLGKFPGVAAFSSGRTHHELLLIEVGGRPQIPGTVRPGLYHLGFKIGDSDDELREAIKTLEQNNIPLLGMSDHTVTHSLYVADPDGNELELYIDTKVDWRTNPEVFFAPTKRLSL